MATKDEIRRVSIYINGDAADLTLKQLTAGTSKLNNELSNLTIGTEEYKQKLLQLAESRAVLADVKDDIAKVSNAMKDGQGFFADWKKGFEEIESIAAGVTIGSIVSMAVRGAIEGIHEFTKELTELELKAEGVRNAFSKIGDSTGYIESLRASSRGLITDLDLEKVAVKANEANIPIDVMGKLLAFAQQRARDTGEDVTELTNRIVVGLGKGTPKALAGLGISVAEVKQEFKNTGDMVQAVSNIIDREMGKSGQDVDTLGDRVGSMAVKWDNAKESLGNFFAKLTHFWIDTGDLADQEVVQKLTDSIDKSFGVISKKTDKDLDDLIKKQQDKVARAKAEADKHAQKSHSVVDFEDEPNSDAISKKTAEAYQAEKNALAALNTEKSKRDVAKGGNDGTIDAIDAQITKQETLQKDLASTSAEWKKYQDVIDNLNKQKKAIIGPTSAELEAEKRKAAEAARKAEQQKKEQEQYLAASVSFDEKLKDFNASQLADTMAKNDKEVQALENKYNKEWTDLTASLKKLRDSKNADEDQIQKQQDAIDQLAARKSQAVDDLKAKQTQALTEKILSLNTQLNDKLKSEADKAADRVNIEYDQMVKEAGTNADQIAIIEKGRGEALNALKLNEEQQFQQDKAKIAAEGQVDDANNDKIKLAKINKQYDAEIEALKKKYSTEFQLTQEFQDLIDGINKNRKGALKQSTDKDEEEKNKKIADTAIQYGQKASNMLFSISSKNRKAELDASIKNLEDQKTQELSNKNLTEAQKAVINTKYAQEEAALKLNAWKADQQAAASQALINGALGVLKLWVSPGFPAAIPLAIVLAADTAAQEAEILTQKPPAYADGGFSAVDYTNPSGWVKRPTLFANSSSGRPFIAGEGNKSEYIVSSQQLRDPVVANFVGMMEANRGVRRFEAGGWSSTTTAQKSNNSASSSSAPSTSRLDRVEYLLHNFIEKQAAINALPVTFNTTTYDTYQQRITQIQTKAGKV